MGGKRRRMRQYIYICLAGLIAVSVAGCAGLKDIRAKAGAREYLSTAAKLLEQGDYEGSLKANSKALQALDHAEPADEALFNIGLIYAHHGYPKRNYEKAVESFKRLVKNFPRSPHSGQAKIWIGVLLDYEKLNKEVEELNRAMKKSRQIDIEIEGKKKEFTK